jgi:hypothetical protein
MIKTSCFVLVLAGLFQTGAMAKEPADLIKKIYGSYVKSATNAQPNGVADLFDKSLYSPRVDKLIDKLNASCKKTEDMCGPGADFFIDGQDYEITGLKIKTVQTGKSKAKVEANFKNFGQPTSVTFDLLSEKDNWVIDKLIVAKNGDRGGYTLDEILKP